MLIPPLPLLIEESSPLTFKPRTYLIFGSFCFCMFFFVWFFVPETKGLSLEAMDELFGVTEGADGKTESVAGEGDHIASKGQAEATQIEVQRLAAEQGFPTVR